MNSSADLENALMLARGVVATPKNIQRLSAQVGEELARRAVQIWGLRETGRRKFRLAEQMFFDRDGLEQASGETASAYHASLFPPGETVADLTCGIGGDLIALARRGGALGYEIDEKRADYADKNLFVHGLAAEIRVSSCLDGGWDFDYAFADPSRRPGGGRTLDPSQFEPRLELFVERMRGLKLGVVKLSPMLEDDYLESFGAALEFVSADGECKEGLLIFGKESNHHRCATKAETGEKLMSGPTPPATEVCGEYFFEALPAAIRAHCLDTLCKRHKLMALGTSNGYLTGDFVESEWLSAYRVISQHRWDVSTINKELKALGAGRVEIKSRTHLENHEKLKRQFSSKSGRELSIAVYHVGKKIRCTILERI